MKESGVLKVSIKMIGIVVISAIIGMLLMWAVYLLPSDKMAVNVVASEDTLRAQDDSEWLLNEEYWKVYDRGTNIIMLYEVIQPSSGNALKDSLLAPSADYFPRWWDDWADVLIEYASERNYTETDYITYGRYWHGYLIFLKPLFLFMDLEAIYILNTIILCVLTLSVAYLFKKRLGNHWVAYILAIMLMHPGAIVQSFQLSTIFYAMQITLLLLLMKEWWKPEQILYIFVIDGVLVAFLDFLTYPFVAFGIPVLTTFLLYKEESFIKNFLSIIKNGIAFAVGYAGMWGMKWILATLFTDENIIANAINSVLHRTGVTDMTGDNTFMSISVGDALSRNLTAFFNEQNLMMLLIVGIVVLIFGIFNYKQLKFDKNIIAICTIMAIAPFLWIVLLSNHCSLHPHLEWRTFAVFIYALATIIINFFPKKLQYKLK